jgi:hypothetical protein
MKASSFHGARNLFVAAALAMGCVCSFGCGADMRRIYHGNTVLKHASAQLRAEICFRMRGKKGRVANCKKKGPKTEVDGREGTEMLTRD